jgi:outer membrane protein assembly factor BamB
MEWGDARRVGLWLAAAFMVVTSALAQTLPPAKDTPNDYPGALPPRKGPAPPALRFTLLAEVTLPGVPAPRSTLSLDGERILVPVEGGMAIVRLAEPAVATFENASPAAAVNTSAWVQSGDGRFRVRALPEGRVESEKLRTFRKSFKSAWSLRVAGATSSPPIVSERRVFFGSWDNQVYAVRRKNGHRLWAADVEERISSALALWRGTFHDAAAATPAKPPPEVEMVLVVPDAGASLIALDVYDGSRLATYEVPPGQGMLATGPLVLPDGRVAVARKSYASSGAALLLLRPEVAEEASKTGPK